MAGKQVAVIVGAGPGLGQALAKRFAQAGFETVIAARRQEVLKQMAADIGDVGGGVHAVATDVTDQSSIADLFEQADKLGELGVTLFNAGNMHSGPILEIDPADFESVWRVACFAGFLVGQQAGRRMAPNKQGTLLFTGATASLRGGPRFVTFASAKAGLRSVAQSFARSLGPVGIHVAHVVIDGVIDTVSVRGKMPDLAKKLDANDGFMKTDEIAAVYYSLHEQPRSTWSFELDIRPAGENF